MELSDIAPNQRLVGVIPGATVTVIAPMPHGSGAATPVFQRTAGTIAKAVGAKLVVADPLAEDWAANLLKVAKGFREALRSRGQLELDEDVYGDAAALSGVSKFSARVKCAMLAWVALEDAIAKA